MSLNFVRRYFAGVGVTAMAGRLEEAFLAAEVVAAAWCGNRRTSFKNFHEEADK